MASLNNSFQGRKQRSSILAICLQALAEPKCLI